MKPVLKIDWRPIAEARDWPEGSRVIAARGLSDGEPVFDIIYGWRESVVDHCIAAGWTHFALLPTKLP